MRFAARVDRLIVPAMVTLFLLSAAGGVYLLTQGRWVTGSLLCGGVLAGLLILRLLAWPVYYMVCDTELTIRTGTQLEEIPWSALRSISPTLRLIPTASAWSFRRLRIKYEFGDKSAVVHVAPVDSSGFLNAIAERSSRHEVEGRSLRLVEDLPDLEKLQ